MSFAGYLSDQELSELYQALIGANLFRADAQAAMRSAIVPEFEGLLPISLVANVQLIQTLKQLNRVHNLVNGDVPLAQFLDVAALLAKGTHAGKAIEAALEKVRYSGTLAPSAPAIAARAPPGGVGGGGDDGEPPPAAALNTNVELQAQTGALDMTVSVRFLRDGAIASASVVKLLVHRHTGGQAEFLDGDEPKLANGSGWIIAPGLLITNHHVINARRKEGVVERDASDTDFLLQAESTRVLFDYVTKTVPAPVTTGAGALLYSNKALDFALLRLPATVPPRRPLRLRSHAVRKTPQQALGIGVNVLQHPYGDPMRLGFRNNYVVSGDDQWLTYLTDTAVGSSGSPVCDDTWMVAALHSGSRAIGSSINILGQEYRRENYGIPITTIMSDLQAHAPELSAEIIAGQAAFQ